MTPQGYPDEQELAKIRDWPWKDYEGLMTFVRERWKYAEYGYWRQRGHLYRLSTGGWSGNEDIIEALDHNLMFESLCWVSSRRGGRHTFDLRRVPK